MNAYLTFALFCFTAFITIINPLSTLPVFLSMTANFDNKRRNITARKAVVTAFIAMVFFAFAGKFIFDFFQITANGFRVAGGILFFIMGFEMLGAKISRDKITKEEMKDAANDISITPLGIPMICGPGAITNSILMMEQAKGWDNKLIVIAVMFVICLIMLITLYGGTKLVKFIGDTGMKVMMRIMGLILMVIAVEFFFSGLKPIVRNILYNSPL